MAPFIPTLTENWFLAPFGGIDRKNFDPDPDTKTDKGPVPNWKNRAVRTRWLLEWFQDYHVNSSFEFVGAYLQGPPAKPEDDPYLTKGRDRNWMANWEKLRQLGWGLWPIYYGYDAENLPPHWSTTDERRGVAAGRHIKSIVANLPGDNSGMVVYIDNEIGAIAPMLKYYRALFRELETDRANGHPPLRAGIYIREGFVNVFLKAFPDAFLWMIDAWEGNMPSLDMKFKVKWRGQPFTAEHLFLTPVDRKGDISRFQIERYPITRRGNALFLPVGRQCTLGSYIEGDEDHPPMLNRYTNSLLYAKVNGKQSLVYPWDFNVCFVPDPRYPQAEPRFACQGPAAIVRSVFERGHSSIGERGSGNTIIKDAEPGAPVWSVDQTVFSVDKAGNLVAVSRPSLAKLAAGSGQSTPSTVLVRGDSLRRLRCFNIVKSSPGETVLLSITRQHKIAVLRKPDKGDKWVDLGIWELGTLHPFSHVAAAVFMAKVWSFSVHKPAAADALENGTLHVAAWPNTQTQQLGTVLKGTAIATATTGTHLFVFAISPALQLQFAVAHTNPTKPDGVAWAVPLQPAGVQRGNSARIHPHSNLASCTVKPDTIQIAGMRSDGVAVVDTFKLQPSVGWIWVAKKDYPLKNGVKAGAAPKLKGFVAAEGWTVNPYGDISLVQNGDETELYCAGAIAGKCGILLRRITLDEPWLRMEEK